MRKSRDFIQFESPGNTISRDINPSLTSTPTPSISGSEHRLVHTMNRELIGANRLELKGLLDLKPAGPFQRRQ
jgi:hypothetical protein